MTPPDSTRHAERHAETLRILGSYGSGAWGPHREAILAGAAALRREADMKCCLGADPACAGGCKVEARARREAEAESGERVQVDVPLGDFDGPDGEKYEHALRIDLPAERPTPKDFDGMERLFSLLSEGDEITMGEGFDFGWQLRRVLAAARALEAVEEQYRLAHIDAVTADQQLTDMADRLARAETLLREVIDSSDASERLRDMVRAHFAAGEAEKGDGE